MLASTIGGLPYPALSDTPNVQTFGDSLTSALDLVTLPRFSSDSAVATAIPSPVDGQQVMRTDIGYGCVMQWSATLSRWFAHDCLLAEYTSTAASPNGDVLFASIPQYHRTLRIVGSGNGEALTGGATETLGMTLNGSSSAVYDWQISACTGSGTPGTGAGSQNSTSATYFRAGDIPRLGAYNGNTRGGFDITISDYTKSKYQGIISLSGSQPTTPCTVDMSYGIFRSANPVTSIGLKPSGGMGFAGAHISLYGIG